MNASSTLASAIQLHSQHHCITDANYNLHNSAQMDRQLYGGFCGPFAIADGSRAAKHVKIVADTDQSRQQ
jgi:hypothetical protein